jgi:hypothetical protein
MSTPEGKTKAKVRSILERYDGVYTYWPVPFGYGKTTLDVLGCYRGRFFCIETKAAGKKPTLRQTEELKAIGRAMGRTFVIAGPDDPAINELIAWLDELTGTVVNDPYIPRDQVRRRAI